jgi:exopolysaccharide biosynthesis polyprenyl glycosylphosphotransferase
MLSISRPFKIYPTLALTMLDFLACFLAILVLYFYRYVWNVDIFDSTQRLGAEGYFLFGTVFGIAVIFIYGFLGIYSFRQNFKAFVIFSKLLLGILVVVSFLVTFCFFFEFNRDIFPSGVPFSRFILLGSVVVSFVFVILGRLLFQVISFGLRYYKVVQTSAIIIGEKSESGEVLDYDSDGNTDFAKHLTANLGVTNIHTFEALNHTTFQSIQELILTRNVDEIYLLEDQNSALIGKIAFLAERYKVNFIFSPEGSRTYDFFDLKPLMINDRLFLEVLHSNLDGWHIILKRIFDILFALFFIIIFSPIYFLIYVLIKLEDGGKVFYNSERVGPDGKVFRIFKFRRLQMQYCTSESNIESLEVEKELIKKLDVRGDGVLYKIANDPRSTKIGRLIERTSLDELPQFFNVLLGNLSVVGPRPHQPRDVAKYSSEHYKVLNIKPGITGLAQINGRSDLKFEQEVKFDCYYIENWSFWLDLKIILKTPLTLLKRHK